MELRNKFDVFDIFLVDDINVLYDKLKEVYLVISEKVLGYCKKYWKDWVFEGIW